MTAEAGASRRRAEMGALPPGMHANGVPFLVWDYLDSWPDEWRSEGEIHTHVIERKPGATHTALMRALWRMVASGLIEYRLPGHRTFAEYRIAR